MDPQELVPLETGLPRPRPARQFSQLASRSCYKVPIRLCRLLLLMIVLPSLFIFVPLYMRYRMFPSQMYPMSMTDMRLIDSKISP
ncbi:jg7447, partial [Pararge aegeria aegeria]